jgi:uncharacterized membrane protein YdjX (TVP38/TMEM64 family)
MARFRPRGRVLVMLAALAVPFVLLRVPAVRGALIQLIAFMGQAGAMGIAAFLAFDALAALLLTPLWLMSGISGYVYGIGKGFLVALPGVTLGGLLAFVVGRFALGNLLAERAARSGIFRAIKRAIAVEGLKISFLLRMTPVMPQNLLSFLLGATDLRLRDFLGASFFGLIPATLAHVYVGSLVKDAAAFVAGEADNEGPLRWILLGGGLTLSIVTMVVTSRIAKRELDRALAMPEDPA